MDVPQQPIVIMHEAIELSVPFFGQLFVELLQKWQERAFGWKSFFVAVDRDLFAPAKSFAIRREPEAVEKVFSAYQRDVPQAWNTAFVFFDGNLAFEPLQQFGPDGLFRQMVTQLMQRGKNDGRTDEENRFVLEGGRDDLVRRADAVNVGRTI